MRNNLYLCGIKYNNLKKIMIPVPSKYVDMLTDFGFKRIFGDKILLISFLNSLFEKEGKVIKSVTYINKEITPPNIDERLIIYDVLCKVDGEEDIIIEMQHKPQETFKDRALYYMARSVTSQSEGKRNWKYKLLPVYGIFITNFHLKDILNRDEAVSEYVLKNRDNNEVFTDKFRMFFIDLLAFKKKGEAELETDLDKWIFNIKNMGTMTTTPKMAALAPFDRLYSLAEVAAMPKRQRIQYEASLKRYWDYLSYKETLRNERKRDRAEARAEGLAEGRAEGMAEGVKQEKVSNARNLKALGVPCETISQATGLSLEDIEKL